MTLEAKIHLISSEVSAEPGKTGECSFDVENTSDRALTVGLEPLGEGKEWIKLDDVELVLPPKGLRRVKATVSVPPDAPAKPSSFRLRAYEERTPTNAVESSAIAIKIVEEPRPLPTPPAPRPARWKLIAAIAGGIVLIGGIVGLVVWLLSGSEVPDVTMVEDRPAMLNEAIDLLESAGFGLGIVTEEVSALPAGSVITQNPPPGADAPDNMTVDLTISMVSVEVPSVISFTVNAAHRLLTEAGLGADTTTQVTGNSPGGTVIDQEPAPGERAIPNSVVTLIVEKELVEVPDLSGATLDAANQRLQERGLVVAQRGVVDTGGEPGTVADQDPMPGTQVDRGTTVLVDLETARITVPSVIDRPLEDAVRQLGSAQLLVVPVQPVFVRAGPFGTVSDQDPKPGEQVPPGTGVTLTVRTEAVRPALFQLSAEALQGVNLATFERGGLRAAPREIQE